MHFFLSEFVHAFVANQKVFHIFWFYCKKKCSGPISGPLIGHRCGVFPLISRSVAHWVAHCICCHNRFKICDWLLFNTNTCTNYEIKKCICYVQKCATQINNMLKDKTINLLSPFLSDTNRPIIFFISRRVFVNWMARYMITICAYICDWFGIDKYPFPPAVSVQLERSSSPSYSDLLFSNVCTSHVSVSSVFGVSRFTFCMDVLWDLRSVGT